MKKINIKGMKMMKKLLVMIMNEVVGVCEVDFLDLIMKEINDEVDFLDFFLFFLKLIN